MAPKLITVACAEMILDICDCDLTSSSGCKDGQTCKAPLQLYPDKKARCKDAGARGICTALPQVRCDCEVAEGCAPEIGTGKPMKCALAGSTGSKCADAKSAKNGVCELAQDYTYVPELQARAITAAAREAPALPPTCTRGHYVAGTFQPDQATMCAECCEPAGPPSCRPKNNANVWAQAPCAGFDKSDCSKSDVCKSYATGKPSPKGPLVLDYSCTGTAEEPEKPLHELLQPAFDDRTKLPAEVTFSYEVDGLTGARVSYATLVDAGGVPIDLKLLWPPGAKGSGDLQALPDGKAGEDMPIDELLPFLPKTAGLIQTDGVTSVPPGEVDWTTQASLVVKWQEQSLKLSMPGLAPEFDEASVETVLESCTEQRVVHAEYVTQCSYPDENDATEEVKWPPDSMLKPKELRAPPCIVRLLPERIELYMYTDGTEVNPGKETPDKSSLDNMRLLYSGALADMVVAENKATSPARLYQDAMSFRQRYFGTLMRTGVSLSILGPMFRTGRWAFNAALPGLTESKITLERATDAACPQETAQRADGKSVSYCPIIVACSVAVARSDAVQYFTKHLEFVKEPDEQWKYDLSLYKFGLMEHMPRKTGKQYLREAKFFELDAWADDQKIAFADELAFASSSTQKIKLHSYMTGAGAKPKEADSGVVNSHIAGLTFKKKTGALPLSLTEWAKAGQAQSGHCKKVDRNVWYHGPQYQVAVLDSTKPNDLVASWNTEAGGQLAVDKFHQNFWQALLWPGASFRYGLMKRLYEWAEESVSKFKYFASESGAKFKHYDDGAWTDALVPVVLSMVNPKPMSPSFGYGHSLVFDEEPGFPALSNMFHLVKAIYAIKAAPPDPRVNFVGDMTRALFEEAQSAAMTARGSEETAGSGHVSYDSFMDNHMYKPTIGRAGQLGQDVETQSAAIREEEGQAVIKLAIRLTVCTTGLIGATAAGVATFGTAGMVAPQGSHGAPTDGRRRATKPSPSALAQRPRPGRAAPHPRSLRRRLRCLVDGRAGRLDGPRAHRRASAARGAGGGGRGRVVPRRLRPRGQDGRHGVPEQRLLPLDARHLRRRGLVDRKLAREHRADHRQAGGRRRRHLGAHAEGGRIRQVRHPRARRVQQHRRHRQHQGGQGAGGPGEGRARGAAHRAPAARAEPHHRAARRRHRLGRDRQVGARLARRPAEAGVAAAQGGRHRCGAAGRRPRAGARAQRGGRRCGQRARGSREGGCHGRGGGARAGGRRPARRVGVAAQAGRRPRRRASAGAADHGRGRGRGGAADGGARGARAQPGAGDAVGHDVTD